MALPTRATWSTALTSALPVPASWAPLCSVAAMRPVVSPPVSWHRVWCRVPTRGPTTTQGAPFSAAPARRLVLDLWALGPAAAVPWAMDLEVPVLWALDPAGATQEAVDPVALDP